MNKYHIGIIHIYNHIQFNIQNFVLNYCKEALTKTILHGRLFFLVFSLKSKELVVHDIHFFLAEWFQEMTVAGGGGTYQ